MKKNKDILIVGFALFSIFFGAGNLIFPPFIGMVSGSNWLTSFSGFVIADVGIILLSIYAVSKACSFQNVVGYNDALSWTYISYSKNCCNYF